MISPAILAASLASLSWSSYGEGVMVRVSCCERMMSYEEESASMDVGRKMTSSRPTKKVGNSGKV